MDEILKRLKENLRKLEEAQSRLRFMLREIAYLSGVRFDFTKQTESVGNSDVGDGRGDLDGSEPEPGSLPNNISRGRFRSGDGD